MTFEKGFEFSSCRIPQQDFPADLSWACSDGECLSGGAEAQGCQMALTGLEGSHSLTSHKIPKIDRRCIIGRCREHSSVWVHVQ